MTAVKQLLDRLNPKVAKALTVASEKNTELLPLKSYGLTKALGGGIGRGKITLLYGNTSAGKSALMMQSVAIWQQMGLSVAYADVEESWDNKWATRLGVDVDNVILIQKKSITRIFDDVGPLLEAEVDVIIIDSISMALPDAFIDEDGKAKDLSSHKQIGAKAKALTTLVNAIHYSNVNSAVVLISQTTTDLSGMHPKQIPDGGKKVLFAASQIIKITSSATDAKQIKANLPVGNKIIQSPVGRTVQVVIDKNKIGPPFKTCEYDFYYDGPFVGIDTIGEVINEAVLYGVISQSGSWLSYGDSKWQGKPAVVKAVKDDPELLERIKADIEKVTSDEQV